MNRKNVGKCQNIIARRSGKITRRYGKNHDDDTTDSVVSFFKSQFCHIQKIRKCDFGSCIKIGFPTEKKRGSDFHANHGRKR
jgi:hypothetical protein